MDAEILNAAKEDALSKKASPVEIETSEDLADDYAFNKKTELSKNELKLVEVVDTEDKLMQKTEGVSNEKESKDRKNDVNTSEFTKKLEIEQNDKTDGEKEKESIQVAEKHKNFDKNEIDKKDVTESESTSLEEKNKITIDNSEANSKIEKSNSVSNENICAKDEKFEDNEEKMNIDFDQRPKPSDIQPMSVDSVVEEMDTDSLQPGDLNIDRKTELTVDAEMHENVETKDALSQHLKNNVESNCSEESEKLSSTKRDGVKEHHITTALIFDKKSENDLKKNDPDRENETHLNNKSVSPEKNISEQASIDVSNTNDEEHATKLENKILNVKGDEGCLNLETRNVFNSTPIQRKFEISSENVSKISDTGESCVIDYQDKPTTTTITETESGTCTSSESEQQSSDGINKYIDAIKKFNGITDTPDEVIKNNKQESYKKISAANASASIEPTTDKIDSFGYEINIWSEENDIKYLCIEKIDSLKPSTTISVLEKTTSIGSDQSSCGSVSSLQQFALPTARLSEISSSTATSTSATSQKNSGTDKSSLKPEQSTKKNKHTFKNIGEVCSFMINHFTKLKDVVDPNPKSNSKVKVEKSPSTPVSKRSRKLSLQSEDGEPKAKQSKHDEQCEEEEIKESVLAKWIDKKYYAGKISGEKPGNKYVVLFEDGASKTLPRESIVFGENQILPLTGHTIYALLDDDYEEGECLSVDKENDKVYYSVKIDDKTIKVTASDIYLEENQAKEIQNKQKPETVSMNSPEPTGRGTRNKRTPNTPEAGFSGSTKKGKKRFIFMFVKIFW